MASAWCVVPITGTGSSQGACTGAYRPNLPPGVGYAALLVRAANHTPKSTWVLARVSAPSLAAVDADSTILVLPKVSESTVLSTILNATQRTALLAKLTAAGISTTGLTASSTVGDVITRIGQTHDINFNLQKLWVR